MYDLISIQMMCVYAFRAVLVLSCNLSELQWSIQLINNRKTYGKCQHSCCIFSLIYTNITRRCGKTLPIGEVQLDLKLLEGFFTLFQAKHYDHLPNSASIATTTDQSCQGIDCLSLRWTEISKNIWVINNNVHGDQGCPKWDPGAVYGTENDSLIIVQE